MSETRGPMAGVVDRWRQALGDLGMDAHGELTKAPLCLGCGKVLNADGNHPAETYAGTWNGLCYGCTKAGPYVKAIAVLDGALKVSWPPHCPSWRRNREDFYAYPGCEGCQGLGVGGRGTSVGGGSYPKQCQPCLDRYCGHPLRQLDDRYRTMIRERAQALYMARLRAAAGVPKRCSYKREQELLAALDGATRERLREGLLERSLRLLEQHERRAAWLQIREWRIPQRGESKAA